MKNTKRGFGLMVGIIILAILAVGGYFVYKNTTPPPALPEGEGVDTVGWKTYTNDKYGFEFKYPSNWVECSQRLDQRIFCLTNPSTPIPGSEELGSEGFAVELPNLELKNQDYNSLKSSLTKQISSPYIPNDLSEGVTANKIPYLVLGQGEIGRKYSYYLFKNNTSSVVAIYFTGGKNPEMSEQKGKPILSTLRFTK